MESIDNYKKKITLEVISKQNPLNINMQNYSGIVGLKLQHFNSYDEPTSDQEPFITLISNGIRGVFNENGSQISSLKTIPWDPVLRQYRYRGNDEEEDSVQWQLQGTNMEFSIIRRSVDPNLNFQPIEFSFPYLLTLSVLVKK